MKLVSKNPKTGQILGEIEYTQGDSLPDVFGRARRAQSYWAQHSVRARAQKILHLREVILNRLDELSDLIHKENGKPHFEAMINDILPSIELLTYFARKAPRLLKPKTVWLNNPVVWHRKSTFYYKPLGVVAVISPWNFPFFLPFSEIAQALLAGNAVVFKPSEVTPLVGLKIQSLCDEAGIPSDLLQTVVGDGKLGAAIIDQKPDKIFFTGSVETGKKIMSAASQYLIPVNLELGGKDAMIILPDADLDFASSAATWGVFGNSGQVCASTERILVHESIAETFIQKLKEKAEALRLDQDLGAITYEAQKRIYEKQIAQAKSAGAIIVTGGEFNSDRTALKPTIVTGDGIENTDIYKDESFGPVVAVAKFKSTAEAIQKANDSRYGLLASVVSKNIPLAEDVAKNIEAGTVTINEVSYTAALPETPWGGVKETGFGKKHSDAGFMEFSRVLHIHKPRSKAFVFKSLWWFPYSQLQSEVFRSFLMLYRKSWFDKAKALPQFLSLFIKFIKTEKRL